MCRRMTCEKCQKPTFAGCGMHVEQVLGDVPPANRCRCREEAAAGAAGANPAGAGSKPRDAGGKWWPW